MKPEKIYQMSVASVYPLLVKKAVRKGRTQEEVDNVIRWLTGYTQEQLSHQLDCGASYETFFADAPQISRRRELVKGVVCGVRVETLEELLMRDIRCLDKLVDELAKGKPLEKILRKE